MSLGTYYWMMAKFLDSNGLARLIARVKAALFGKKSVYLGTCSTTASSKAKVATTEPFDTVAYDDSGVTRYKPATGTVVGIKYSVSNTNKEAGITLNVNDTGDWPFYYNNAQLAAVSTANTLVAGYKNRYAYYMFNGSQWVFLSASYDANSTYSAMTQAEITAGSGTTGRTLTPKLLRDNFYTESEVDALLLNKEGTISDLSTIRSGAALGATALQSFTETDPTVPSWAKQSTKPSYTASEVGALPVSTFIPNDLSDLSDDSTHRLVTDSEKSTWNGKQDALVSGTNIKTVNGTSLLGSGNISVNGISNAGSPATPDGTWSMLLDSGDTITVDLNHEHSQYLKYELVNALPASPDSGTLYLIAAT